jgi:hypothetical protein
MKREGTLNRRSLGNALSFIGRFAEKLREPLSSVVPWNLNQEFAKRSGIVSYPVKYTTENTVSTEMFMKNFPTRFLESASFPFMLFLFISVDINTA